MSILYENKSWLVKTTATITSGVYAILSMIAMWVDFTSFFAYSSLTYRILLSLGVFAGIDGMHIRLLMLTFFLQFYPDLVRNGHVYILQTPLFRVRNKKETYYCYSDEERIAAKEKCGKQAEITRFKGLGEISPDEFRGFIGPNMRLEPVILRYDFGIKELLEYYMGKNTMERQKFIIENLRIEDNADMDKV